jgi:hypothetical protein
MKTVLITRGVYLVLCVCMLITVLVALLIRFCFPPINIPADLDLIAPKVGLLAAMIALTAVQYNYFITEARATNATIEKADFGPLTGEERKKFEAIRSSLSTEQGRSRLQPDHLAAVLSAVERMDAASVEERRSWTLQANNDLADFAVRFGILFSIILLIFSSVLLDFLHHFWGIQVIDPSFSSLVTFFMAIVLGFFYLVFMLILVQRHIRTFGAE